LHTCHRGVRTTRLCRPRTPAIVFRKLHVHRIPPHVRDVASAPLVGWDGQIVTVICISEKQKYFCFGGLPRQANQGSRWRGAAALTPRSLIRRATNGKRTPARLSP